MQEECEICKRKQENLNPITLDGTSDFYNLEVCDICYSKYGEYYFSPEVIDGLIKQL